MPLPDHCPSYWVGILLQQCSQNQFRLIWHWWHAVLLPTLWRRCRSFCYQCEGKKRSVIVNEEACLITLIPNLLLHELTAWQWVQWAWKALQVGHILCFYTFLLGVGSKLSILYLGALEFIHETHEFMYEKIIWIHSSYEFIHIFMYMNSYLVYEFMYLNSYAFIVYINSYLKWIYQLLCMNLNV